MARNPISFDTLNRRTHLYLGLFLLPWFFVYGLSSVMFSHHSWFAPVEWVAESQRDYRLDPVPPGADLRPVAEKIQKDANLQEHFGVYRSPQGRVELYTATFWKARRVVYDPDRRTLTVLADRARWNHVLTRLHTRGGFEAGGFLPTLWSLIVDLVQLAIVVWIASGLYMWWRLGRFRVSGGAAIAAGCGLFLVFLLKL